MALLVGATSLPATAAPTWLKPATPISEPSVTSYSPIVAADAAGNVTAVWTKFVSMTVRIVQSAYRPAGGTWTAPVNVSGLTENSEFPELAVDANGYATVVWSVGVDPGPWVAKASSRAPGGGWSAPATLSDPGNFNPLPRVAVDPAGNATAIWWRFAGSAFLLEARTRPAGATAWNAVDTLDVDAGIFDVAASGDGTVVAVWADTEGSGQVIRARERSPAGTWASAITLSPPGAGDSLSPSVAGGTAGRFAVVWERAAGAGTYFVQSNSRSADGVWGPYADVSIPTATNPAPTVALDPAGNATAAWLRYDGVRFYVRAANRPAGSTWSPSVDVSADSQVISSAVITADGLGTARLAWTRYDGANWVVQTSDRPTGGSWSAPLDLSDPSAGPVTSARITSDPAGNAVVTWEAGGFGVTVINAVGLDGAGPATSGFSVPASGQTGQSLSYAATATDSWSAVTGYSWSFGDGGTATGATATHAYAAAGTYTVTMTATDAVGNTTTRTATTSITAAPPALAAPTITKFKLTEKKIRASTRPMARAVAKKTKLKVGLSTAATLKLVFKSKHKHLVKGKKKYVRVVLERQLPAGLSKVTIKAKLKGKVLKPDTYVLTGTAKNSSGKSPKKKVKLKVVR